MRDIKFRVWDSDKAEFIKDKYLYIDAETGIVYVHVDAEAPLIKFGCIVMQYTGLKDKNGKEIYEGDNSHYEAHPKYLLHSFDFTVIWNEEYACFGYNHDPGYGSHSIFKAFNTHDELQIDFLNHCEIIGNIYENPELSDASK